MRPFDGVEAGVTLLEIMLVLVIGAAILIIGLRQYNFYRKDVDILDLKTNVDILFNAMDYYYKANCYGIYTLNNGVMTTSGTLNPEYNPPPDLTVAKPIKISADLVMSGFLVTKLATIFSLNAIVDTTGTIGEYGYVAQFNPDTSQTRKVCLTMTSGECTEYADIGTILFWRPQVAIKLNFTDPALIQDYLSLLGGDCLSSEDQNGTIHPCIDNKTGDYIVWERLSSLPAENLNSSFWQANPLVQQFNQMYRTLPINYLISTKGQNVDGNPQYFLCGG